VAGYDTTSQTLAYAGKLYPFSSNLARLFALVQENLNSIEGLASFGKKLFVLLQSLHKFDL
jgi:hypothetical protein